MGEERAALEADVQRLEAEIQQIEAESAQIEDELKKKDEEKRELEAKKATLDDTEKSAKENAEQAKESGDENAMSLAAGELDKVTVELADAVAQFNQKEEEMQSLEAKKATLSIQLDAKKNELETQKSRLERFDADKAQPEPQSQPVDAPQLAGAAQSGDAPKPGDAPQPGDAPLFNREQMLKTLEEEKTKAKIRLVHAQEGGGKQLDSDMDKWLDVLKKLRKDGVINESDVKLDKVEQKIKSNPSGDSKKIQDDIDEIDRITNIQDDNKFQEEFAKWQNKLQAGGSAGSPKTGGTPGKPGMVPDAGVLAELKEAEARAARAATEVEALKTKLAGYSKKEKMTADDIKDMEEKQKLLMEKMAEFEEITKLIQRLIGLTEIPSSQLGLGPSTDGDKGGRVDESLPKVIICGTGDIDTVPRIIVCETAESKDGKRPVFQELPGTVKGKSGTAVLPGGQSFPARSAFPGGAVGYPGVPSYLMANYPGGNVPPLSQCGGYPGGPGVMSYPGGNLPGQTQLGGYPGVPGVLSYPGGTLPGHYPLGGYPGDLPGGVNYLPGPSPYPGRPSPNSPGNLGTPLVPPCVEYYNKTKEEKKSKKQRTKKIDPGDIYGCNNWCKEHYDKKLEKKRKKCFCQLAGFCPNN